VGAGRGILDSGTRRRFLPSLGRIAFSPPANSLVLSRVELQDKYAKLTGHPNPPDLKSQHLAELVVDSE
jgi:hypothetical protein